jgi:hypothetical protein
LGLQDRAYPQSNHLQRLLQAALSVDTAAVSEAAMKQGLTGLQVGQRVEAARLEALRASLALPSA